VPRPADLKDTDLARWGRRFEEFRPHFPPALARLPHFREQFLAGEWLGEQLLARKFTPEQASDICFAHGQRAAHSSDPWEIAEKTLDDAMRGQAPAPGPDLSGRLLAEAGLWDNPDGLLGFLLSHEHTPDEFDHMIDGFRQSPRYPPEQFDGQHAALFEALNAQKLPNIAVDRLLLLYTRRWNEQQRGR
jgi:hypothetical protein